MLTDITVLLVGAFIGWNVPQPSWAKRFSAWAEGKIAVLYARLF